MMDNTITEFGIKLNLAGTGFNEISSQFKHIVEEGKLCGKSVDEITDACDRLKAALTAFNLDKISKLCNEFRRMTTINNLRISSGLAPQFSDEDIKKVTDKILAAKEIIAKIDGAKDKALKGPEQKSRIELLDGNIKKLVNSWAMLKEAIAPVQMLYRWVEGIAKINHELRMLHYSSGLAIESLKSYGNVAKLYGGSADSVASYEKRYEIQKAKAIRGQGLGHMQEAYWQFGFGFDFNESAKDRFRRAIIAASSMSNEDRLAFAQLEAPGREKELLSWAQRGVKAYDDLLNYQKEISGIKTVGGKNLLEAVSEESEKLAESENKLSAQFEAIKNEIAATLIPLIRPIIDGLAMILEGINSLPPVFKRILIALGALTVAFWTIVKLLAVKKKLAELWGAVSAAGQASNAASTAGSMAGSAAGAARGVGGAGALAAGIGGAAISAIGDTGIMVVLYQIADKILTPWYIAWKAYIIAQGMSKDSVTNNNDLLKYMVEGGLTEGEAARILLSGKQQWLHREQMFHDDEQMYQKLNDIVKAVSASSESAVSSKAINSYIAGNVETNNDNRSMTINQHFVSSGDVQKDALLAAESVNSIRKGGQIANVTSERM